MVKFLKRLALFFLIPLISIIIVAVALPPTPRASKSLLFSKYDKDQLFETALPPRLILIGGSNLAYGIDSAILEEGLGLNPVNTAIHVTLGAKYMFDNSLKYIIPGDVIVVSLEYQQFFGKDMYGGEELLRTVMDVDRTSMSTLNLEQWLNIIKYLPEYSLSKIKPSEYNFKENPFIGIYERGSFNEYGDAYIHWTRDPRQFKPHLKSEGEYNSDLIAYLLDYEKKVHRLGARLYLTFPGLQAETYQNMAEQISLIESELLKSGLELVSTPSRYRFETDYFHDTPYHLTKDGVVLRTAYLVEDLQKVGVGHLNKKDQ